MADFGTTQGKQLEARGWGSDEIVGILVQDIGAEPFIGA